MKNFLKLAPFVLVFGLGFALCMLIQDPGTVESIKVKTSTTTDTVYRETVVTLSFDSLLYQSLEDSIESLSLLYAEALKKDNITIVKEGEPIFAPVRHFSGFKPTLYGNIGYDAIVAGTMLKFDITQDLRIPTITNTINTTVTKSRDIRGLYAGASVSDQIDYKLGASYVNKKWQFNYDYQPKQKIHWVGVKKRLLAF